MRNASKEKEYNKAYMAGGILGFKKNLCCLIFVFLRKTFFLRVTIHCLTTYEFEM